MSDEGRSARDANHRLINHWCEVEGCGQWGGFGFAKGREIPRWWCWGHYPHKPNTARREAAEIAEMIAK